MSLQTLLYGTGPDAEADAAADLRAIERERAVYLALPVAPDDAVLDIDRGEHWLTLDAPARLGDVVRRHGRLTVGRHPTIDYCRTFATSEILEEFTVTAAHLEGSCWRPRVDEQGEGRHVYTRVSLSGYIWAGDRHQAYRWAVIRAASE